MTKAQAKVYDALVRWVTTTAYAPSLQELAAASGLKSISATQVHVQALIRIGKVRRSGAFARGLEVVTETAATCPTCGQALPATAT